VLQAAREPAQTAALGRRRSARQTAAPGERQGSAEGTGHTSAGGAGGRGPPCGDGGHRLAPRWGRRWAVPV